MNLERLREYLKMNNYEGILLRQRSNFSWLTNGQENVIIQSVPEGVADFVITQDQVHLITSKMEERRILEEECANLPFNLSVHTEDWFNNLDGVIKRLAEGRRMATDTPFDDWHDVSFDIRLLRSSLTEDEVNRFRILCQEAANAVEATCREIEPGQTEHEIAAVLAQKVVSKGMRTQVLLVATDDRIYNYRHPIPTNKKLIKHAMIVLCAERGGLVANVTRLVYFGEIPNKLKVHRTRLARIHTVMNETTKPGNKISDVLRAGIEEYKLAGFPDDWKLLHQGGLAGFDSREFLATLDSNQVMTHNQVFAWNPSLPGVKSEDTIRVTKNSCEVLTHTDNWVYIDVEYNGQVHQRPDILIRKV